MDVLGFYNTLNVVCGRVQDLTASIKWVDVDKDRNPIHRGNHIWNVAIPFTLLDKKNLSAHIFVNGYIVNPGQYHLKRINQYLHIELDRNIDIHYEDQVHVEIFDATPYTGEYYSAALGAHYLVVDDSDIRLFICSDADVELTYPNPRYEETKSIYGYLKEIDPNDIAVGYLNSQLYDSENDEPFLESNKVIPAIGCFVIDDETEELYQVSSINSMTYAIDTVRCEDDFNHYIRVRVGNEIRIYFKNGAEQKKYLAMTKHGYSVVYNETFHLEDFWNGPIETGPVTVHVKTWSGETAEIPVLDKERLLVYLNCHELVPDVDYTALDDYTDDGRLAGVNIVIQNSGYLNDVNNLLVFSVNERLMSTVQGFYVGNKIEIPIGRMTDFQCLSTIVMDGLTTPYEKIEGREGALYRIRTLVPEDLEAYYESFAKAKDEDIKRILEIANVIDVTDNSPGLSLIDHSHSIYSTTMQTIIRDVLLGQLTLLNSNDDNALLAQVQSYFKLADRDLVFTQPFDLRYLDVEMSYRTHLVTDVSIKKILDRLFTIIYQVTDEVRSYRQ